MQDSGIPIKFPIPFANAAGASYINPIPEASQIGISNGAASLTDGFPPNCFVAPGAGGAGPFGKDFNGLLKQVTAWLQWLQAGGPITYDAAFQSAVGGYPLGSVIQSASTPGLYWRSTTDNNVTDPDTGGAGWVNFLPFADLNGSSSEAFSVANASIAAEALALGQNAISGGGNNVQKQPFWNGTALIETYEIAQRIIGIVVGTPGTVTFPTPFPTAISCLVACFEEVAGFQYVLRTSNASVNGFNYSWDNFGTTGVGTNGTINYIAKGY